jgi:pantoate kinase|tara:strand:- start:12911 stop:13198 length:288 start_codon:yes stop_codon:yes gene_type:complete
MSVKRQGKTKGATSFVMIPLHILNERFMPKQPVKISRKFAEETGLMDEAICVGHSKTQTTDFSKVESVEAPKAKVQAAPQVEIVDTTPDFRVEEM